MLTKETAKGHVGLTSTICRNLEFYQNDTKIQRKLAYEMYSCVQLLGGFAPRPPDQGLCTWTPLGAQSPDPHYRLALPRSPLPSQLPKLNSADRLCSYHGTISSRMTKFGRITHVGGGGAYF